MLLCALTLRKTVYRKPVAHVNSVFGYRNVLVQCGSRQSDEELGSRAFLFTAVLVRVEDLASQPEAK
jgi:hypothetical protein